MLGGMINTIRVKKGEVSLIVSRVNGIVRSSEMELIQLLFGEMLLEGDELNREVEVSALINKGVVFGRRFHGGHDEVVMRWPWEENG
jgi:hypothetical protein